MKFTFVPQALPEVLLITHERAGDARGFFAEVFREEPFRAAGIPAFVQENMSRSTKGVLRGLHYQKQPQPQGKLVRCARGAIFDVAVDVRHGSPNFGKWVGVELTEANNQMLWVPVGFAHGFVALAELTEIVYKTTGYYAPSSDAGVRWDDPAIGVAWPVSAPLLSDKDQEAPFLRDVDTTFHFGRG